MEAASDSIPHVRVAAESDGPSSDWLTVAANAGAGEPTVVPILGRLFVGRVCAGVSDSQRLVVDDPRVSREHFSIRVDPGRGAVLTDHSSNGTSVRGRRVERDEPLLLHDGDLIEIGDIALRYGSSAAPRQVPEHVRETVRSLMPMRLACVVGDVVGYTTLTERSGPRAVAAVIDPLIAALRELVAGHAGSVTSTAGDSLFAAWDATYAEPATARAVAFALAASALVDGSRSQLTMGWGVTLGYAATGDSSARTVHGDAVNLAFRLSSIAAREDRPSVLVSTEAAQAAPRAAGYGEPQDLVVRGRSAPAIVVSAAPVTD
jgi:class 3 adenylate cyclase